MRRGLWLAPAVLLTVGVAAADAPVLENNPFARPNLGPVLDARVPPPPPAYQLRATLTSGADALANIDGRLLAVGERIDDSTIIAIHEGRVTLARDGVTFTLTLRYDRDDHADDE